jgi:hypothetical protein
MKYSTYVLLFTGLVFPVGVYAQTALETEVRAAIAESAREQSLTSAEIDTLVQALSDEAADQGISASDVASAQVALVSQPDGSSENLPTDITDSSPVFMGPTTLSLLLVALAILVLWLWRKMRHGGALGPIETA